MVREYRDQNFFRMIYIFLKSLTVSPDGASFVAALEKIFDRMR